MAITITGGKYASAALASVGTTTVTVSTTPFSSGDFAAPRRVDLYNSTGTTFKGMAFVRKYNSTNQLQLETEFLDPKTGVSVSQVVGDTLFVSKSWTDVVQAGISISNGTVTISDTLTFGVAADVDSVCFHDEDLNLVFTVTTAYSRIFDVAGGFVTFGHLQNYSNRLVYGACNFYFANTQSVNSFAATSTAARLCVWGGSHRGGGQPLFTTGGFNGSGYGTDWAHLWLYGLIFANTDILSKGVGANWSAGSNHVIEDCSFVGTTNNLILLRFGNGVVKGGQFKFPNFTSAPISVFGSDAAGTYAVGAPAGLRSVVLDIGNANSLWRCANSVAQTVNITNLISTSFKTETGGAGTVTKNVYFEDSYTNLNDATSGAVIRDSDWTADDTGTSSGSASGLNLSVFYGGSTALTENIPTYLGPWTARLRKYGYDEVEAAIAESNYSLGTAGTSKNVSFGGRVNQIARESLTDSAATALAYTGITVTDHGASPVTWQGKDWSISVTVDLATYPSRTAAQVFAHIKAGIAQTATWNGKAGLLWHVLMEEAGNGYISQRGKSGGAGASLKGVRIIDQSGNPLPGVTYMTADDGTTYTPPIAVILTLSANISLVGAEIRIYDLDNSPAGSLGTELGGTETCGDATFPYTGAAGNTLWIQIMAPGYEEFGQSMVMPASSAGFIATLRPDASA